MELCNCIRCKNLFSSIKKAPYCNSCDNIVFGKIKEYLKEHRGANGIELSDETGISTKIISFYIKEGRLDEYKDVLKICECGAILKEGQKICSECMKKRKIANELLNEINRNVIEESKLNSSGFHTNIIKK